MLSTIVEFVRQLDSNLWIAVLACLVCTLASVAALRALFPRQEHGVAARLEARRPSRRGSAGLWSYRVLEARD